MGERGGESDRGSGAARPRHNAWQALGVQRNARLRKSSYVRKVPAHNSALRDAVAVLRGERSRSAGVVPGEWCRRRVTPS